MLTWSASAPFVLQTASCSTHLQVSDGRPLWARPVAERWRPCCVTKVLLGLWCGADEEDPDMMGVGE